MGPHQVPSASVYSDSREEGAPGPPSNGKSQARVAQAGRGEMRLSGPQSLPAVPLQRPQSERSPHLMQVWGTRPFSEEVAGVTAKPHHSKCLHSPGLPGRRAQLSPGVPMPRTLVKTQQGCSSWSSATPHGQGWPPPGGTGSVGAAICAPGWQDMHSGRSIASHSQSLMTAGNPGLSSGALGDLSVPPQWPVLAPLASPARPEEAGGVSHSWSACSLVSCLREVVLPAAGEQGCLGTGPHRAGRATPLSTQGCPGLCCPAQALASAPSLRGGPHRPEQSTCLAEAPAGRPEKELDT